MSYILFTGAPGSKWSGVARDIYKSKDIDQSDYKRNRVYKNKKVNHVGSYFDPGMEFGPQREEWDKPFSGKGKRIIKSHTFSYDLDNLSDYGYPIVFVYRPDYECYKWWQQAGGFDIKYPNYKWYKDSFLEGLECMWWHIQEQNREIMDFIRNNEKNITTLEDNFDLLEILKISEPKDFSYRLYSNEDIKVYVWLK